MAAAQVGMPDAPLLIYPRDLVSEESPEQLLEKAHSALEEATRLLLRVGRDTQ